jgi:hypothetical protein
MAHFAKLDENNVVLEVVVVNNNELIDENGQETEAKGIDFLVNWSGGYTNWKQTSYNGKFRKNYAGIGFSYDQARDAFIYPKIYNSWILNEETCKWEAPVPMPNDGKMYSWDEESQTWVEVSNGD